MLRPFFTKPSLKLTTFSLIQFNQQVHHSSFPNLTSFINTVYSLVILIFFFTSPMQRELHSRNKKAMEFIAKGWSALKEVDRVIDYCELNDRRLIPLLRVMISWIISRNIFTLVDICLFCFPIYICSVIGNIMERK